MSTEARQLALRHMDAAKRGASLSRDLLQQASKETMRAPGSRAAVLAQQAYDERMSAETSRFTAAFALLAADLGKQARSARDVAQQVKDATQQRVLVQNAQHAERRADALLEAAKQMAKATDGLPGVGITKPPSAQQVTVGNTQTFRPASFTDRFTHFFPADIRAASSSLQGVDTTAANFRVHADPVMDAAHAIGRDLPKLRENMKRIGEGMSKGSGDPAYAALVQKAIGLAGLGELDTTPAAVERFSAAHYGMTPMQATIGGLIVLGAIVYFTRS